MNPHLEFLLSAVYDKMPLDVEHRADLEKSGITDATRRLHRIRTVPPGMIDQLAGFHVTRARSAYLIPFPDPRGGFFDYVKMKVFSNDAPDASANGEGATFLGATSCVTGGTGNCSWTLVAAGIQSFLAATTTDAPGNTSEFSATSVGVGEAVALLVSKGAGSSVNVAFGPACGATDHVAYLGTAPAV